MSSSDSCLSFTSRCSKAPPMPPSLRLFQCLRCISAALLNTPALLSSSRCCCRRKSHILSYNSLSSCDELRCWNPSGTAIGAFGAVAASPPSPSAIMRSRCSARRCCLASSVSSLTFMLSTGWLSDAGGSTTTAGIVAVGCCCCCSCCCRRSPSLFCRCCCCSCGCIAG